MSDKSKGLGDDIARFTHFTGIDTLASGIAKLLGKEDCGCEERKEFINKLVPYPQNNFNQKEEQKEDSSINKKS